MTSTPNSPVPLSQPYYGAPFGEAIRRFYKKYATFTGRASRAEFWWWMLVFTVVTTVLQAIVQNSAIGRLNADGSMSNPGPVPVLAAIVLIMACVVVVLVKPTDWNHKVIVIEAAALLPFAFYWVMQGIALRKHDAHRSEPILTSLLPAEARTQGEEMASEPKLGNA